MNTLLNKKILIECGWLHNTPCIYVNMDGARGIVRRSNVCTCLGQIIKHSVWSLWWHCRFDLGPTLLRMIKKNKTKLKWSNYTRHINYSLLEFLYSYWLRAIFFTDNITRKPLTKCTYNMFPHLVDITII